LAGCAAMRASTLASHACGSISLSFAVIISVTMTAARSAPRSEPANSHDFRPSANPQGAFGRIVRETNAAVARTLRLPNLGADPDRLAVAFRHAAHQGCLGLICLYSVRTAPLLTASPPTPCRFIGLGPPAGSPWEGSCNARQGSYGHESRPGPGKSLPQCRGLGFALRRLPRHDGRARFIRVRACAACPNGSKVELASHEAHRSRRSASNN